VDFGSYSDFVCTNAPVAEEYFAAVKACYGEAWLLRASLQDSGATQTSGFDIGTPTGGFSVIEQELIAEGFDGPTLNRWGLIGTLPEALAYLEARKDNERLEQSDYIRIISIHIVLEEHSS
jgi:hypothetical protein